jgi:hypothetical protein
MKTKFDDLDVALQAWRKKARINETEFVTSGRVVLEKENSFGKGLAHSEGTFAARIDGWIT